MKSAPGATEETPDAWAHDELRAMRLEGIICTREILFKEGYIHE